ncbi:hypothetical protein PR202_ga10666 [Eleusine coracana subsp. coracana]|uniref:At1g61320/AtMIF1 LRR domain-containing protein n=1 Tax=Eleusine coracana subsp. coracana TaxID=191504 RepID=A0AAV5C790_ELECO|nr:hypothetical protein PR202_ga10666 [Eleusine coracana subsp. coracana]
MSRLSLKEAAKTSIVARNWRKLWTSYPNLCFDGTRDQSTNDDSVKIEAEKFIETVNSIFQQHYGIGLNKFSIRFSLQKKSSHHLDRWIFFAAASKARSMNINLWPEKKSLGPAIKAYNFPLEALDAQDGAFIQSLVLKDVSIKPQLGIHGFAELRRLCLHCAQIIGDLADLLLNCIALEDLELITCSGVVDLKIPHRLDKLRHLLISSTRAQVHKLVTGPACMFTFLRHLTCEIRVFTDCPNSHDGILQLARYLEFAPQLEVLELHIILGGFLNRCFITRFETHGMVRRHGQQAPVCARLDHLKRVYMSGFLGAFTMCFQVEL